jgi:hypothetical protein
MKTIEWVFIIGGIALFVFLTIKMGNKTPIIPQYRSPTPHEGQIMLHGLSIHQVDFIPPMVCGPDFHGFSIRCQPTVNV